MDPILLVPPLSLLTALYLKPFLLFMDWSTRTSGSDAANKEVEVDTRNALSFPAQFQALDFALIFPSLVSFFPQSLTLAEPYPPGALHVYISIDLFTETFKQTDFSKMSLLGT